MTSMRPHPLDIPEIIALIGQFIPLWSFREDVYSRRSLIRDVFQPRDLLSAALVNRTFHQTLTPLLWQVYDDALVHNINPDESIDRHLDYPSHHVRIPPNILFAHCQHFRVFHNIFLVLTKTRHPLPLQHTWFLETCTHLRELTLSRRVKDELASELISRNPTLRLLSWECVDYIWPVMRQRNYDALSVLHKLETLHLGRFVIDHEKLCEAVLRRNAASLKELSFKDMVGFTSEEVWGSFSGRSHSDQEGERGSGQDGDHQRNNGSATSVSVAPGILLSKLKILRLDCKWGVSTISEDVFYIDGYPITNEEDEIALYADEDETQTDFNTIRSDNLALPGLLRCCPALESLSLRPHQDCDTDRVGRLLREYCPRLDTIKCVNPLSLFDNEAPMEDNHFVSVIQGCMPPPPPPPLLTTSSFSADDTDVSSGTEHKVRERGLKCFEMSLLWINTTIISALLVHASSLQVVELYFLGDGEINFENACRLLQYCPRLKRLGLRGQLAWKPLDGLLLFQHEWGCQQLESLCLDGFCDMEHGLSDYDEDEQEAQEGTQLTEHDQDYYLEQSQEQSGTIEEEMTDLGLVDAFSDSWSSASSNATAASSGKYRICMPGHWRIVGAWKTESRQFESSSESMFRRALFQRADSMPNLVHLGLNEMHYARDKPN